MTTIQHIGDRRRLLWRMSAMVLASAIGCFSLPGRAADAAPPERVVRIGYLGVAAPGAKSSGLLIQALNRLGYVEGRNLDYVIRHAEGYPERLPQLAAELVAMKVDVIVGITNGPIFAARQATSTIPIVAWAAHGAVETGLVSNLRRPGGNITGTESLAIDLDAKRVQLLRQLIPGLHQFTILADMTDQGSPHHIGNAQQIAHEFGLKLQQLKVRNTDEFEPVLSGAAGQPMGVLMPFTSPLMVRNWSRIHQFAMAQRLPTLCEFRVLVQAGCLMSYGPSFEEINQRTAVQIDKILHGTPPGELPVERPTRFELAINLQTAQALGLTVPEELLLRADEVIR